jgi:hypothetical protein
MRGRSSVVVAILGLMGAAGNACAREAVAPAAYGAVVVPMRETTMEQLFAVTSGRLVVDGRCLLVGTYLVVWPANRTEWDPVTGTIRSGGIEARVGDRVAVGGGDGGGPLLPPAVEAIPWRRAPASECLRHEVWFLGALMQVR